MSLTSFPDTHKGMYMLYEFIYSYRTHGYDYEPEQKTTNFSFKLIQFILLMV